MNNLTMGPTEWIFLIILSVLWGGSFFFAEIALRELAPLTIVLARVGIAALALVLYVYAIGLRMPTELPAWGAFFVMGALNNMIPFSLIVWGQVYIESGLASILNGTTPLFTVVLAHFLTQDERLTANRLAGVIIGIIGVIVLIGPAALKGLGAQGLGQLAILGAAISYAFAGIYGRRLSRLPTTVAATGMLIGSTIMMIPLALYFEQPFAINPSFPVWGAILGIALLSTGLAYLLYFRILAAAGSTNLLLVTFLIPISAILLGVLVLGERLSWNAFVGMGLIFLGLAAIDGRLLALRKFKTS